MALFAVDQKREEWSERLDREVLVDGERRKVDRACDAIFCKACTNGHAELVLSAEVGPWSRKELRLVIGSNCAGTVSIHANGKHVQDVNLTADGRDRFRSLTFDVTSIAESTAMFNVKLIFELDQEIASALIVLATSQTGSGSRVLDIRDLRYTVAAATYHVAAWATIITGFSFWYLSRHLHSMVEGAAPIAIGMACWLASLLIPGEKIKSISPQGLLRKSFAALNSARIRLVVCSAFVLVSLMLAALDAQALLAIHVRYKYKDLVEAALQPTNSDLQAVARAFIYLPWRREAFLSYEYQSWLLKRAGAVDQWHSQVARLVADGSLVNTAKAFRPDSIPWYLVDPNQEGVVSYDPVIALAHILPEGEDDRQTTLKHRAIDLLATERRGALQADLLRLYLEYDVVGIEKDPRRSLDDVVKDLEHAVAAYDRVAGQRPHEYLAALDLLGYHFATKGCDKVNVGQAISFYSRVLEDRKADHGPSERVWIRSPGKFTVFHFWRYIQAEGDKTRDSVWGRYFDDYRPLLQNCSLLSEGLRGLFKASEGSLKQEIWTRNSGFTEGISRFTREEVQLGWRY